MAGHYAISIETLTFGKLLATRPWFQPVMVRMLSGINAKLEREASQHRDQVSSYLASLLPVVASGWLFGACISSADVVVAVLCSRLAMAGELGLLSRADLQSWWQRYQQRPAFSAADLWLRFQRRRFLQSLLEARHTSFS